MFTISKIKKPYRIHIYEVIKVSCALPIDWDCKIISYNSSMESTRLQITFIVASDTWFNSIKKQMEVFSPPFQSGVKCYITNATLFSLATLLCSSPHSSLRTW